MIKADISKVQGLPEENLEDIVCQKELIARAKISRGLGH